jgi:hypothetical protein
MWQMVASHGNCYLAPRDVVNRLSCKFAYVETSEEDAQRHVLELIQQLRAIASLRQDTLDELYLARLEAAHERAICVHFGDEVTANAIVLSTAVIPGEPLVFEYPSSADEHALRPLVARCAEALGYTVLTSANNALQ